MRAFVRLPLVARPSFIEFQLHSSKCEFCDRLRYLPLGAGTSDTTTEIDSSCTRSLGTVKISMIDVVNVTRWSVRVGPTRIMSELQLSIWINKDIIKASVSHVYSTMSESWAIRGLVRIHNPHPCRVLMSTRRTAPRHGAPSAAVRIASQLRRNAHVAPHRSTMPYHFYCG